MSRNSSSYNSMRYLSFSDVLKSYSGVLLFLGAFLFFGAMTLSKAFHVLYFEQTGYIINFGSAYSAMALSGIFTPLFWKKLISLKRGFRAALFLGCIAYSTGISLRIYPESIIVCLVSGSLAGFGATLLMYTVGYWIFNKSSNIRSKMTSVYGFSDAIGSSFFLFLFACLLVQGTDKLLIIWWGLLICSIIVLFSLVPFFLLPTSQLKSSHLKMEGRQKSAPLFSVLKEGVEKIHIFFAFLSGILFSFIGPYIPVILSRAEITGYTIMIFMGIIQIISALSQPVFSLFDKKKYFIRMLICMGLLTMAGIYCLSLPLGEIGFAGSTIIIIIYVIGAEGYGFYSAILRMSMIRKKRIATFMTVHGIFFLFGDMIGGYSASIFYKTWNYENIALGLSLIFIMMVVGYIYLVKNYVKCT